MSSLMASENLKLKKTAKRLLNTKHFPNAVKCVLGPDPGLLLCGGSVLRVLMETFSNRTV